MHLLGRLKRTKKKRERRSVLLRKVVGVVARYSAQDAFPLHVSCLLPSDSSPFTRSSSCYPMLGSSSVYGPVCLTLLFIMNTSLSAPHIFLSLSPTSYLHLSTVVSSHAPMMTSCMSFMIFSPLSSHHGFYCITLLAYVLLHFSFSIELYPLLRIHRSNYHICHVHILFWHPLYSLHTRLDFTPFPLLCVCVSSSHRVLLCLAVVQYLSSLCLLHNFVSIGLGLSRCLVIYNNPVSLLPLRVHHFQDKGLPCALRAMTS